MDSDGGCGRYQPAGNRQRSQTSRARRRPRPAPRGLARIWQPAGRDRQRDLGRERVYREYSGNLWTIACIECRTGCEGHYCLNIGAVVCLVRPLNVPAHHHIPVHGCAGPPPSAYPGRHPLCAARASLSLSSTPSLFSFFSYVFVPLLPPSLSRTSTSALPPACCLR